jgi:hypothetical protein
MAEDKGNEAEEQEEVEEAEASQDDDLDIDLGPSKPPPPSQGGGCRGVTAILFILLIAIAAASIFYSLHLRELREKALEAKAARIASYQAKFSIVVSNVDSAVTEAEAGNLNKALELLENAEAQLTLIGSEANQFDDQQWAGHAMRKKQFIIDARQMIASHQEVIQDQFNGLKSKFAHADLKGFGQSSPDEAVPEEPQAPAVDAEPAAESDSGVEPTAPREIEPLVEPVDEPASPPQQ